MKMGMPNFATGARDISNAAEGEAATQELAHVPELAVDLEADSMHAFRARLCFVQVGTDTEVFLFDTLAQGVALDGLRPIFADPQKTKFFHAASGDLQYLSEVGVRVQGLFDTHRAATLLGWPKVGLADLARERLGVTLLKEHQQSDFSIRPLPAEMRAYIADDVRYLCEIGRQVLAACVEADILEEVQLDCQRMCDEAAGRPEIAPFRPKIPKTLPRKEQAFQAAAAQALHQKRLLWAEAANLPMGRMLSNAGIAELIAKPPPTLDRLRRVPNVRGSFVREHGAEVLELLQGLRDQADRGGIEPPEDASGPRDPKRRKREDALRELRGQKATERKVTASAILPNPLIEELAARPPASLEALGAIPYFGAKRLRLYGEEILKLLQANRSP
jgi:ribonuclease D